MNASTAGGEAVLALLEALQDILHNRIKQKKGEIHKTQNIADTESLWTETFR
jgi:hypothetical protein